MAHELAFKKNGAAAMAFVGATPWHGLGQCLTEDATIEQWTKEAGMDWQAKAAPVGFVRDDGTAGFFSDKRVIYRADTGAALSVMGDKYQIVQPGQCLDFFGALIKGHGFKLHTAGVLYGGRKLWALARNGQAGEVVKGDKVSQFLMLSTSLDGTSPTTAAFTSVRIVCANTLGMAHRSLNGAVKVHHRTEFDIADVQAQMGFADQAWSGFMERMQTLAARPVEMEQARDILRKVFGQPKADTPDNIAKSFMVKMGVRNLVDVKEQKSVARCLELFAGAGRGATHAGVKGTRWGLLNAVTEHIDHEQGRSVDARLNGAWFGRGAAFKAEALKLISA